MKNNPIEFSEADDDDDDEGALTTEQISQAVLYASDWTTETVLSQLKKENIDFNPRFQRRDAWSLKHKSRFVESLALGLPIPQIVLAEKQGAKGKFIVLDGKQRLLTLLQFSGHAEGKNNSFSLTGLDVLEKLSGKNYEELSSSAALQKEYHQFCNQPIRSMVIRNWPNVDFLHLVFVRLNTGSVKLSPQELRQAAFPGPFLDRVDDFSISSKALKALLGISEPDFRMRDIEVVVRHVAYTLFLNKYGGNLKKFLDDSCKELNSSWSKRNGEVEAALENFELAVDTAIKIFGNKTVARRWTGTEYESRLNRAVLDLLTFYFSEKAIRKAALKRRAAVVSAYKELCESNAEFRDSIELTTKSLTAVANRLGLWGGKLRKVLKLKFSCPALKGKKIQFDALRS